jgi:uncharacterized protein DUF4238
MGSNLKGPPLVAPRAVARSEKPENQHYVPKFWLRLFGHGDGNGLIWAYDKVSGETRVRSVNKSAAADDYYAVNYPDARRDMALEREFSKLETYAAPMIKALAGLRSGHHALDALTMELLAGWVALSYARVPATIDSNLAMAKFTVAVETDMLLRNPEKYRRRSRAGGSRKTDEEIEAQRLIDLEDHKERRLIVEPAPETGLTGLGIAVEHIKPVLVRMSWHLFRRRRFPYFVLGDQPITLSAPGHTPLLGGPGFTTPDVEVYVPLAPDALLVGSHNPSSGGIDVLSLDELGHRPSLAMDWSTRANAVAFTHASREVFGHSQGDVEAIRLMLRPEDRRFQPGMRVSGLPKEWERYLPAGMINEPYE